MGGLFNTAPGSHPVGKSAVTSKVELSQRRKKVFLAAVEAGGIPLTELTLEEKGNLVRDHLVPTYGIPS